MSVTVLGKKPVKPPQKKKQSVQPSPTSRDEGSDLSFSFDAIPNKGSEKTPLKKAAAKKAPAKKAPEKPAPKKEAPKKEEKATLKRKRGRPKKEPEVEVEEQEVATSSSEDSAEKQRAKKKARPAAPKKQAKKPAKKKQVRKADESESEESNSSSGEEGEAELEKEKARTFTFTLNESRVKTPEGPDKVFMDFLKQSHETSKETKGKAGKGKGQKYETTYRGQKVTVRLDRQKAKYYPRTSFGEEPKVEEPQKTRGRRPAGRKAKAPKIKDLKTKELQGLLKKSGAHSASFLQGVRGEKLTSKGGEAQAAYKDGVGVRAVLLSSDAIDYPDNAGVTIALLSKVTASNYEQLFSGGHYEGSYGALPSQNTNTKLEGAQERTGPYAALGTFVKDKTLDKSNAISNIPTLRKFQSLASFDPSLVTIHSGDDVVPLEDFSTEVRRQAIKARKKKKRDILPRDSVFSDPEDESEEEQEKYGVLEEGHLEDMDREFAEIKKKLERKQRLIQSLLASKKEERAQREAEPKEESEEDDSVELPKKKKATPTPRKRKDPPKEKQKSESEEEDDIFEAPKKATSAPKKKQEPPKKKQESEEDEDDVFEAPKKAAPSSLKRKDPPKKKGSEEDNVPKKQKKAAQTPRRQPSQSSSGRGKKPNNTTKTAYQ